MDLIDRIKDLASRVPKQLEHIQTEEATKECLYHAIHKCPWL